MDQREINLAHIARPELLGEIFMSSVIARDDHGSRSFPVEPMHDAGTQRAARAGKFSQAMQKRIHQSAARMARTGVYDHPRGLVHDYKIGVEEQQFERQIPGRYPV